MQPLKRHLSDEAYCKHAGTPSPSTAAPPFIIPISYPHYASLECCCCYRRLSGYQYYDLSRRRRSSFRPTPKSTPNRPPSATNGQNKYLTMCNACAMEQVFSSKYRPRQRLNSFKCDCDRSMLYRKATRCAMIQALTCHSPSFRSSCDSYNCRSTI